MKGRFLRFSPLKSFAFSAASLCSLLGSFAASAQTTTKAGPMRVAKTVKTAPSDDLSIIRFTFAALKNKDQLSKLAWSFGGKLQNGWNIYVPLISRSMGTAALPDSADFASALADWQTKQGLNALGIVDAETMSKFVSVWQAQRQFRYLLPDADRLISAPIDEFFDQTRSPELLKLDSETYSAYKKMIAAAERDLGPQFQAGSGGKYLSIISAYRSPEYQAALRRKAPNSSRSALAKFSAHSTGRALDIYVGGDPVSTKDANRQLQVETPAYKWLVKNASRFGFYPYFYEPWHWEYVPEK